MKKSAVYTTCSPLMLIDKLAKSALGGVSNNHKDIRFCFLNVCYNPETDVILLYCCDHCTLFLSYAST